MTLKDELEQEKLLHEYFKTQFDNLEDAKKWFINWKDKNGWNQDIPGHPEWSGDNTWGWRTLCSIISKYLEHPDYMYKIYFAKN